MKPAYEFKLSKKNMVWQQAFMVSFSLAFLTAASVAEASDLQIYVKPSAGKKTLIMMLDTSGSMGWGENYTGSSTFSIQDDYSVCVNGRSNIASVTSTSTPSYTRYYCAVPTTNSSYNTLKDKCELQSNSSLRCFDRLTRLKDGMFAFLDSTDTSLDDVLVGVGNFSIDNDNDGLADSNAGQVLVGAKVLGASSTKNTVGSQRYNLKTAIANLKAYNGTPSAHAYAEAAAYLMGTTTYSEAYTYRDIAVERTRLVRKYVVTGTRNPYSYTYTYVLSTCNSLNATTFGSTNTQTCSSWSSGTTTTATGTATTSTNPGWTNQPAPAYDTRNPSSPTNNPGNNTNQTIIYSQYESQLYQTTPNINSGMPKSKLNSSSSNTIVVDSSASNLNAQYKTPLPAVADRVSCDGQGVYFLSDGDANGSSTTEASAVMTKALTSTYSTGTNAFSCPSNGLVETTDGAWSCMGEFAKRLYDKTKNPTGVSIQTAFVGFGKEYEATVTSTASTYTKNACQMSSRSQSNRSSDDACSPGATNGLALTDPGYGNGGFFQAKTTRDVTDSVTTFIGNLGARALSPLPTGATSVPVDALNPSGFQPYGYLRMLEPNPSSSLLIWRGNLKKYNIFGGALTTGASSSATKVFNNIGEFSTTTKDIWNNGSYNDGGIINLGGAYSRVPMPATGRSSADEDLTTDPKKYIIPATPNALRPLFTDVASANTTAVIPSSNGSTLLRVPEVAANTTTNAAYVLGKLNASTGQTILKDFPLLAKLKILNYLGYSVPLDSSALPTTLSVPVEPFLSMGGIIHSFPVQMTYTGSLKNDELDTAKAQSVLYGTMEGGLHLVDSSTGVEQMVFVPAEILNSTTSKALRKGETDLISPSHGVDAAWVADPAYTIGTTTQSGDDYITPVTAKQMNVYGGLRMGGSSYYALDLLTATAPKLLFKINATTTGFSRLGQTWSKPVLANIRYNGKITRVMIVGGGYDPCYENPRFRLNASVSNTDYPDTSCNSKAKAQGNAVYMIDAKTGALIWSASDSGASTNNTNMTHSIVSRISTLDRDADGLIDHLYFGDLGGQLFRADLNNASQRTSGSTSSFGVRVVRLANLATSTSGAAITTGDNPRFYEAPTLTIHDQGVESFILAGIASGDRSTPLDVSPTPLGREGMLPAVALTGRPVNNVYGVIDRDFINKDLFTIADTALKSKDKTLANFQQNPQLLSSVVSAFFPYTAGTSKEGWYRSLSSTADGTEKANGTFRKAGSLKAFEEPVAITGNLLVPVYDPEVLVWQ